MKKVMTWDELMITLENSSISPEETGWTIFRYLKEHLSELSSTEARMLLYAYCLLPIEKPSLLHSCILSVALKMSDAYSDFKLFAFLKIWGSRNLRKEDYERPVGKNGRTYPSLTERLVRVYSVYRAKHSDEPEDAGFKQIVDSLDVGKTSVAVLPMIATTVFVIETNGKKRRAVKLVGACGEEQLADFLLFHSCESDIVGNLFDVLMKKSAKGNLRVIEIMKSHLSIEALYGKEIGYVRRYDERHGHYHIFDNMSRHFVAQNLKQPVKIGDYVWFCPIIPAKSKFKSAVILCVEDTKNGREAFGAKTAK